jgi:hypothetical protein
VHQRRKLPIQLQPSERLPIMVRMRALPIWKLRVEEYPFGRSSLMVRTLESLIRKLLAADVRPAGRCAIQSGRCPLTGNISPRIFQKILSHSCPSRRPMSTVRTVPRYILPNAHLSPQPINRGPWALRTARILVLNSSIAQRRDISSKALFKCDVAVLQLKSILEVGSKVRSSIEHPFR